MCHARSVVGDRALYLIVFALIGGCSFDRSGLTAATDGDGGADGGQPPAELGVDGADDGQIWRDGRVDQRLDGTSDQNGAADVPPQEDGSPQDGLNDGPAPDTLVPDVLAPDTLAPDTLAPDTLAPDTLAPDVLAPDTLAPDTLAPDVLAPDTLAPDVLAPDTLAPDIRPPVDMFVTACAGTGSEQVFTDDMRGCAGVITYPQRARLCINGFAPCTAREWIDRRAGKVPHYNYWVDEHLGYGGSSFFCAATTSNDNCPRNEPMRVCASKADALGNTCNWTGCGFNRSLSNEYFGGCANNDTAGTLCCR